MADLDSEYEGMSQEQIEVYEEWKAERQKKKPFPEPHESRDREQLIDKHELNTEKD